ncbi:MAG: pseudaminic acid biosynthesis-associated methylase [Planctomycetota bacterium]|jgi:pseudaminic acid biosynthesis-associated methylase
MDEQKRFWTQTYGQHFAERWDQTVEEQDKHSLEHVGEGKIKIYGSALSGLNVKSVMEVGCGVGVQLRTVKRCLGAEATLWGVEPFPGAIMQSQKYPDLLNIVQSDCYDIPFKDGFFDLVFTHCVLIHIHPDNLIKGMKEIYRASSRYILGYEYWADKLHEVEYRGHKNVMWKGDYAQMYMDAFPDLKLVYSQDYEYFDHIYGQKGLLDKMFVLEKSK